MRDTLPAKINRKETAIVNLDSIKNPGTHWVSYYKDGNTILYYDSFGNLKPPAEVVRYFNTADNNDHLRIYYNYNTHQKFNSVNCGHLCLKFLLKCFVV